MGLFGTEVHHPNTTTDLLKGEPWQLLLSRIGDTLMLYLLMHTSLFLPLPNGCFLQVTGPPIAEVSLMFPEQKMKFPHKLELTPCPKTVRTSVC